MNTIARHPVAAFAALPLIGAAIGALIQLVKEARHV